MSLALVDDVPNETAFVATERLVGKFDEFVGWVVVVIDAVLQPILEPVVETLEVLSEKSAPKINVGLAILPVIMNRLSPLVPAPLSVGPKMDRNLCKFPKLKFENLEISRVRKTGQGSLVCIDVSTQ